MQLKSKLGLGSVQFGVNYGISNTQGQTSSAEVKNILSFALETGITTIDTASGYGSAEKILGENELDNFQVISKYILPSPEGKIAVQLLKTLADLKIKSLYGYMAHRPMEIINNPGEWEQLKSLKEQGLIKKIGFSLNMPSELSALLEKGFEPDIIQAPFNYLDTRFENAMKRLKESGCEIHSRSAFLQGLFFRPASSLPDFFEGVKPILTKLQSIKFSLPGALLRFVLEKDFIDKVIIGVENVIQLKQNLADIDNASLLPVEAYHVPENILMPFNWPKP